MEVGGLPGVASTFTSDKLTLNGAGEFAIGGPEGDNGLSGKKLVIDYYGPGVPIGGGALAGKDPHKVDKSGALRARQLAKKLVRQGVDEAQVTLGWAPGGDAPFLIEAWTSQGGVNLQLPRDELPAEEWLTVKSIVPRPGTHGARLAAPTCWQVTSANPRLLGSDEQSFRTPLTLRESCPVTSHLTCPSF